MTGASFHGLSSASSGGKWPDLELFLAEMTRDLSAPLRRVRVDAEFSAVCTDPEADISIAAATGAEAMAALARCGIEPMVVMAPKMGPNSAWQRYNGGVPWDDFRRIPAGGVARKAGYVAATYANFLFRSYREAGGTRPFNLVPNNEEGQGGAGSTLGGSNNWVADIEAYNAGEFTGVWDTTAHWTNSTTDNPKGWADLLDPSPTYPVSGIHDSLEDFIPVFFSYLDPEITVWMGATACENLENEFATWRPEGYTWFLHPRFYDENGRFRATFNRYIGSFASRKNSAAALAREIVTSAVAIRKLFFDHFGGPDKVVLRYTEWGTIDSWLENSSIGRKAWDRLLGDFIVAASELLDANGFAHYYFTVGGWSSGVDPYAIIKSNGNVRAAMARILFGAGYNEETSPDGTGYVTTVTGETNVTSSPD